METINDSVQFLGIVEFSHTSSTMVC